MNIYLLQNYRAATSPTRMLNAYYSMRKSNDKYYYDLTVTMVYPDYYYSYDYAQYNINLTVNGKEVAYQEVFKPRTPGVNFQPGHTITYNKTIEFDSLQNDFIVHMKIDDVANGSAYQYTLYDNTIQDENSQFNVPVLMVNVTGVEPTWINFEIVDVNWNIDTYSCSLYSMDGTRISTSSNKELNESSNLYLKVPYEDTEYKVVFTGYINNTEYTSETIYVRSGVSGGKINVKVNGSYRKGFAYIKNSTWKKSKKVYIKKDNVWKESI